MNRTHGLTHVALAVRDLNRSVGFYEKALGLKSVYRQSGFAQLQTPGTRDVLVLEEDPSRAGRAGGVIHFGFRLQRPSGLEPAKKAIEAAGGTIRESGEFVPGEPYLFAHDPDGYEFEVWFEIPTPLDPRPARARRVGRKSKPSKRRSSSGRKR